MPLGLTAVDKADGTGATATITGSAGGTVTINTSAMDQGVTSPTWTAGPNRTGDGVLDVPLSEGYSWLVAIEGATIAGPIAVNVTDGSGDNHQLAIAGIIAKAQALVLTGLDSSDIVQKKIAWNREKRASGVYVVPLPATLRPIVTEQTMWSYNSQLTVFRKSDRDEDENPGTLTKWRKQLMDAFDHKDLPAATKFSHTLVHDKVVFDPTSFDKNYDASAFVVEVVNFENR